MSRFTGRIDQRLSLVFGVLFVLVLLVTGVSLYLLGSLLLESDAIARQSEEVRLAERAHATLQRFLSAVEDAYSQGASIPEGVRSMYATELESIVARFLGTGGAASDIREIRQLIADAGLARHAGARPQSTATPSRGELAVLRAIPQRMETLAERISAGHEAAERHQVRQAHRTLQLTIAVNIAFVVVGTALLLLAQRYFHRAIGVPLRRLADCAVDIADGAPCEPMPVTSTDEIGRLTDAFNRMARQLREHEDRLKGLVTLEERQRLARELHDNLAQDLALLRLKLIEAEASLGPDVAADTKTLVHEMFSTVDAGYQNLREAIFGLQALDLKTPDGLVTSLGNYLRDFGEMRKLPVELQGPDCETLVLEPQAQTQLIRIIHEALSNIVRHAGASKATVRIDTTRNTARITIADDGRGFVPEAAARDAAHFGLRTMKERAESVGGTLAVRSLPGHGTQVILELPMKGA